MDWPRKGETGFPVYVDVSHVSHDAVLRGLFHVVVGKRTFFTKKNLPALFYGLFQ